MRRYTYIIIMLTIAGCKKPYNPVVVSSPNSYLVVEGVININDTTKIKLSRTVNISNKVTSNPVLNAVLSVEGDNNFSASLTEAGNGLYTLGGAALDNTRNYRLRIKTDDNKEYLSDFEKAKVTPPIDSIGFSVLTNGIQVYANSHDPANNTRYYRYEYDETWAFHSKYYSAYKSNDIQIVPRYPQDDIYHCFANNSSSTITLASSAKLLQDVIFQAPITAIPSTSEKIETKYSILLRQYALTPEAFKFWTNLKKNTEQLGSIFDAQPSQISGNIHNIKDATEPVIGFISVCSVQSKRVFIANQMLPQEWKPQYPYQCSLDSSWFVNPYTKFNDVALLIPEPHIEIPVEAFFLKGGMSPAGYLSSDQECVDCRIRGYSTPPPFWQQ